MRQNRLRRSASALLVATAALALLVVGPALATTTEPRPEVGWGAWTPGIGGQLGYDNGELVYQDWLYDDTGAATNVPTTGMQKQFGALSKPSGSFRYPTDAGRYGANAADIDQVRFTTVQGDLRVLVKLNTMLAPDAAVIALVFGTAASSPHPWPYAAGVSTPGDVAVTAWGTGAGVTDLATGTTQPIEAAGGSVSVDVDANTIELSVPIGLLPGERSLRVYGASGLWDPAAGSWMDVGPARSATAPGGGTPGIARLWNVAFRTETPVGRRAETWWDDDQSAALKAGDISASYATVDLARLRAGATEHPALPRGQIVEGIYHASYAVPPGEGVSEAGVPGRGPSDYQGTREDNFLGADQPYALYVPVSAPDPAPLAIVLHGGSANHMSVINQAGAQRDMGDGDGRVLLSPLGRGPNGQYTDEAELDVLEALADVERHIPIDLDDVALGGYSMGGFGVYRIAARHPDLFSSAVVWAGRTGSSGEANGDPHEILDNLRDVPVLLLHGAEDELEPWALRPVPVEQRLDALGYEHRFRTYAAAEHLTFALVDHWGEAARWMRVHRRSVPRRVTYKYAVGWDAPAVSPQLTGDHAYWLSGITPRQPGTDDATQLTSYATVDAEMTSLPGPLPPAPGRSAGVDDVGPYADVERAAVAGSTPLGRDLQVSVGNTSAVTVDVAAGGLADGRPFCLRLSTDGPVALRLAGAASFHAVLDPTCAAGAATIGGSSVTMSAPGAAAVALVASP